MHERPDYGQRVGWALFLMGSVCFAGESPAYKFVRIAIRGPIAERPPLFTEFAPQNPSMHELLATIRAAKTDPEVLGMVLAINDPLMGWACTQELRSAILDFRSAKKYVECFLESADHQSYLIAAASDSISLAPLGYLSLVGLRLEAAFLKDLLVKIGVEADLERIGKYKSAGSALTESDMPESMREELGSLLDDVYEQLATAVAESRKFSLDEAKGLLGGGPYPAAEAKAKRLIDHVEYYDEFVQRIGKEQETPVAIVKNYGRRFRRKFDLNSLPGLLGFISSLTSPRDGSMKPGPKIAVLYAVGPILQGSSSEVPWLENVIFAERMVKALKEARKNEAIKAIVLRVNSGGGSALASDLIWRELMLTKKEKPVVVSMSDLAASGGYYISMAADAIVAEPGTLTGSIGVVGGKFNLRGLYDKIGVKKVVLARGENATIFSDYGRFSESERRRLVKLMQGIYETFVAKAAEGRKKTVEELEALAGGRVWTGNQAKKVGLVDELGGLDTALALARERSGIPEGTEVQTIILPKQKSFFEYLMSGAVSLGQGTELIEAALKPYLALAVGFQRERVLAVAPCVIEIK